MMWKIIDKNLIFLKQNQNLLKNLEKLFTVKCLSTNVNSNLIPSYQKNHEAMYYNLKKTEKVLNLPLEDFLLNNLIQSEYDIVGFALKKVNNLRGSLNTVDHPVTSIIDQIFDPKTMNHLNDDNLKLLSENSEQLLGSVILVLLAKCLQTVPSYKNDLEAIDFDKTKFYKQINFAKSYETLDKGIFIHHKAVINFPNIEKEKEYNFYEKIQEKTNLENEYKKVCDQINNCNKLSVLSGDYLLSFSITNAAQKVDRADCFDFFGAAIDDYVINQFDKEKNNESLDRYDQFNLPKENVTLNDFENNSGHAANSLFAISAQYISELSGLGSILLNHSCYKFGWNLKIKWNIEHDLRWLFNSNDQTMRFYSLPVILYIQKNKSFVKKLRKDFNEKKLNVNEIKKIVSTEEIIKECYEMHSKYKNLTLKSIDNLPKNETTEILKKLI